MKKYINIILCMALLNVCYTQAQENIYLHKKNGNIEAFAINQVDSASFSYAKSNFEIISPNDTIRIGDTITMTATRCNDQDLNVRWYAEDPSIAIWWGTPSMVEGTIQGTSLGQTTIYASSDGDIASTPLHVVGRATSLGNTEIYWKVEKTNTQSGTIIPFSAQYDSKDKIDHTEIWYDVNEVVSKSATCHLIKSFNYTYADSTITPKKQSEKVKDFAHKQALWDASVQAHSLIADFPIQLHDSLLPSRTYSTTRDTTHLAWYLGNEFPKQFKDNLTQRMTYASYVQVFSTLGVLSEEYISWMTDSTFNANSAKWEKHFKQYDTIWSKTNFDTLGIRIDTSIRVTGRPPHRDTVWTYDTVYVTKPWLEGVEFVYDQIMEHINRIWNDSVRFLDLVLGETGYDFTYQRKYELNTYFRVAGKDNTMLKTSDTKKIITEHDNDILKITPATAVTAREAVKMNVEVNEYHASQPLTYYCTFPKDVKDHNSCLVSSLTTTDIVKDFPKSLIFSHVGLHNIKVDIYSGEKLIDKYNFNIQVGYNKAVPTLYYATAQGNIMAYKLTNGTEPADMNIYPYDLGFYTQHAFNLLFKDSSLYVLDAGKQFYYINDVNSNLGDGKISVVSKDGSRVETMISNVGGPAFQDPFYGYVEGDDLYYADRNTGIIKLPLSARNQVYNVYDHPYYVQQNTLGYYNNGWVYGSIGGMFGKINGIWHWTKFYNANGIFRFEDSDILPTTIVQGDASNRPAAGIMLEGMMPKSFVYVPKHNKMLVHIMDVVYNGIYAATYDEFNAVGPYKNNMKPYAVTYNGMMFESNTTGNLPAKEGYGSESVGITQMVYDEINDCVYFAYRNNSNNQYNFPPTGIYSYSIATGRVTCLIMGVEAYGIAINNQPSKLF